MKTLCYSVRLESLVRISDKAFKAAVQGQGFFKCERTMIKNEQERQRIGNEIATLRKEKGMTQQNLADRVEMQRAHIARIEAGRYSVGLDTLTAIGKALGKRLAFV